MSALSAAWTRSLEPGGFAIPVVVMFLVAISLLAAAATVLTTSEQRIAGLYGASDRAHLVAGSGLEHAMGVYRERGTVPGAWPARGEVDRYEYEARVASDSFDFGSGRRPVWLDTRGRRNGEGRGQPVHVLTSTARRGAYTSTQRLWVARWLVPRLPAAVTLGARGGVRWSAGDLSGIDVSESGVPVDPGSTVADGECAENRPAVHMARSDAAVPILLARLSGNSRYSGESPPYTTRGPPPGWRGAQDVIGGPSEVLESARRSGARHHLRRRPTLRGVTWITDRAGGPGSCLTRRECASIEGEGILFVHNPRYDPREHDSADPLYDPLKAASPAHQPARLVDISGGTFRGLVVVDRLPETTSGPFSIVGALVELTSTSSFRVLDWHPDSSVRYSCSTLVEAARSAGLGPEVIAWKGP